MTALHSITAGEPNPECPYHDEDGLVCEQHPEHPWFGPEGECCGAPGMFCPCTRWPCGSIGSNCACASDPPAAPIVADPRLLSPVRPGAFG